MSAKPTTQPRPPARLATSYRLSSLGLIGLVVPAVYGTYVWFRRVR